MIEKLKEIKNEVAKKHGCYNWEEILDKFSLCAYSFDEFNRIINEAILEVANHFCKLQRESDHKRAKITNGEEQIDGHRCKDGTYVIDPESILTNPLVTEQ